MKALTIWQPWASLIMAGAKPYEFRRWPAPRWVVGERIVIHAGARPMRRAEILDLIARLREEPHLTGVDPAIGLPLLERVATAHSSSLPHALPLAAGLGAAILGQPRKATALFGGTVADSDRIDQHVWAWPLTEIEPFATPIRSRGAQGFWNWQPIPAEAAA